MVVANKVWGEKRRNKMRKAILEVIKGQYFSIPFSKMHENMHISCLRVCAIMCGVPKACVRSGRAHVSFLRHLQYLQCSGPLGKIDSVHSI